MVQENIDQLISLIFTTGRVIKENDKDGEKPDPFSFLRLETLHYIEENKNPTMRDVAEHLCITSPSATSLVDGLVESGQLERLPDTHDRRLVRLLITKKGKENAKIGFKKIRDKIKGVLTKLSSKERDDLVKILKKISEIYEK